MRGRNLVEVDDVGCLDPGLALGASLFPAPTAGLWPKPLRGFGRGSNGAEVLFCIKGETEEPLAD